MLVARLTYVKTSLAGTGLDVWNPRLLIAALGPGPGPRSGVRGPGPWSGVRGPGPGGAPVRGLSGPPVRGPGPGLGAPVRGPGLRYGARFPLYF